MAQRLKLKDRVSITRPTPNAKDKKTKSTLQGVVEYVGPVKFAEGDDWVGIRLIGNFVGQGRNDGSVDGVLYFEERCRPRDGIFVRRDAVTLRDNPFERDSTFMVGQGEVERELPSRWKARSVEKSLEYRIETLDKKVESLQSDRWSLESKLEKMTLENQRMKEQLEAVTMDNETTRKTVHEIMLKESKRIEVAETIMKFSSSGYMYKNGSADIMMAQRHMEASTQISVQEGHESYQTHPQHAPSASISPNTIQIPPSSILNSQSSNHADRILTQDTPLHSSQHFDSPTNYLSPSSEAIQNTLKELDRKMDSDDQISTDTGRCRSVTPPVPTASADLRPNSPFTGEETIEQKERMAATKFWELVLDYRGPKDDWIDMSKLDEEYGEDKRVHGYFSIPVQNRGTTICQLHAIHANLERRCETEGWTNCDGKQITAKDVCLSDVNKYVIKPFTEFSRKSLMDGATLWIRQIIFRQSLTLDPTVFVMLKYEVTCVGDERVLQREYQVVAMDLEIIKTPNVCPAVPIEKKYRDEQ